ncbi:formate--tetrahydrofolate ligase [Facklamia sp. DSM 111018]|uniref:Formate--tetrahydrofolate ligase n=1 Tax=Facklamia lactis TaxID=2749967 RepID=A0ABS0LRI8_9LACT|nr:formate--tetrahydrofolate ligase [Facklamia lactis]MBG9980857.1 formate--tetrahydrofolate ligase [Facklamia lactis]MBG9986780.1 formate--tetrahydrofolate ligase [Facklamia lactis]
MKTDIQIAQEATLQPIEEVAAKLGISNEVLEPYGKTKAKIDFTQLDMDDNNLGKLILVTAITPTPAGEGKTTTSIGLADGLSKIGKKTAVALREPSLGPVFGVKGGAAGGGYAQVVPMEDINLHFTGDFHAIGAATNLIAALLDNHIHHGNALDIDVNRIVWRRVVDMNDRQLRNIVNGLGRRADGVPREDGYDIVVASEVMAAFCLSNSLAELKEKLGNMIVAYTRKDNSPVTVKDINGAGAATALLKDAIKPNIVQTLEGTPAFIHGGPFANIAHGCNSIIATKLAMNYADYTITEAGFGADLGAEKFIDIKARQAGIKPDAVVVVATIRALKMHGGVDKKELGPENVEALRKGMPNLLRHIDNLQNVFGLNPVVAINAFPTDTEAEIEALREECEKVGVKVVLSTHFVNGGEGAVDLANAVVEAAEAENNFKFAYDLETSIEEKVEALVTKIYRGAGVEFTPAALKKVKQFTDQGMGNLPICMAKTQYSFSDDKALVGAPEGFKVVIRDLTVSAGAGFIVCLTGDIMKMPGLPKEPAANRIDVDEKGNIEGLF